MVYSPLDAVRHAQQHGSQQIVFFAVGFETTTPATALAVKQAAHLGLTNFSLLVSHVRVLPAMEMLMRSPGNNVEGFLAAGHVCTVTGLEAHREFVADYKLPVIVTGFEPVDLLTGILEAVQQLESGSPSAVNCYGRSVAAAGNQSALQLIDEVYEIADRPWRGLGVVPDGGLRLRSKWAPFDAEKKFERLPIVSCEGSDCRSGEVLTGKIKPTACEHFGARCTPESPLGAPMVSAEGVCAAYYRYNTGYHLLASGRSS
jgi:hydrogenase expression/formation protein HypD